MDGATQLTHTVSKKSRSSFGKQSDSKKANAPVFNFNSHSDREQFSKVYLSAQHVEVDRKCREGPGPGTYQVPTAIERQIEGNRRSSPCFSFSHTERMKDCPDNGLGPGLYRTISALGEQVLSPNRSPQRAPFGHGSREQAQKLYLSAGHVTQQKGTAGPPPGTYDLPCAMGSQHTSTKPSSPSFTLSRTDRLKNKYEQLSKTLPAVGQYDTWHSIGKQPLSPVKTEPAYGFGSSNRDTEAHRYLTSGHVKSLKGTQSPSNFDHQTANTLTSFGMQPLSRQRSTPSYGFGSSPKNVFKTNDTPGPGYYD